ncbi:hypothetical protein [Streptomyces sp. 11x1]|nr:hypothetical protein [Streptomyces sp. 11x1]WNZ10430.1 hypothetical protein P8T65_24580 [Streptomyces sp. 11x1]
MNDGGAYGANDGRAYGGGACGVGNGRAYSSRGHGGYGGVR